MVPLKSKTEYQYKKAAFTITKILNGQGFNHSTVCEDISVFKGMINRSIRQDQWDWFTVYMGLGAPDPSSLKPIPKHLTELRKGIKDNNQD